MIEIQQTSNDQKKTSWQKSNSKPTQYTNEQLQNKSQNQIEFSTGSPTNQTRISKKQTFSDVFLFQ
jgi:hypothetical protein